jgi:alpha,alpha-trehalase
VEHKDNYCVDIALMLIYELLMNKLIKYLKPNSELEPSAVLSTLNYINELWPSLTVKPKDVQRDGTLIKVDRTFLAPSVSDGSNFDFSEMYYWDSYFMCIGFMQQKTHKQLVVGIIDNLVQMFNKLHVIPNANRTYLSSHSQPPFMTTFAFQAYKAYGLSLSWLKNVIETSEREYYNVWVNTKKPHWRNVYKGLSRFYDINMLNDMAEAESGWDMTPRFNRLALEFLPVDLNTLLYKYEKDFAEFYSLVGNQELADLWSEKATKRAHTMHKLMWSKVRSMYFDYNFIKKRKGLVASLATYYPMWAGMVSQDIASKLKSKLKVFDYAGGLSATSAIIKGPRSSIISRTPTQWAYPNGWAPLHYLTTEGLEKYGYHDEAKSIALKWLKTCTDWYLKHGEIIEKYNVAQPNKLPQEGVYPNQVGFGWTNSIYIYYANKYFLNKDG